MKADNFATMLARIEALAAGKARLAERERHRLEREKRRALDARERRALRLGDQLGTAHERERRALAEHAREAVRRSEIEKELNESFGLQNLRAVGNG